MTNQEQKEQLEFTYDLLASEIGVTELRIMEGKYSVTSGYYNDREAFIEGAMKNNGKHNVYVMLNPVNPALLARSQNRLKKKATTTTKDSDIARHTWILIDCDPRRPAGISSTDTELNLAREKVLEIQDFLNENGFPEGVRANSGNGFHCLLYTDLPVNKETSQLISNFLKSLDFEFSDEHIKVDTTTYNAARICKAYGTKACKGDDTEDRPHRFSYVEKYPDELIAVSRELLEKIASKHLVPQESKVKYKGFDLKGWMAKNNIKVAFEKPCYDNAIAYILEVCPFNEAHNDHSACIIQFPNGAVAFKCHHDGCSGYDWHKLRDLLEPGWNDKESKTDKEKQVDILLDLVKDVEVVADEFGNSYGVIEINGHIEVLKTSNLKFKYYLLKKYYEAKGTPPGQDTINGVINVLRMEGAFNAEQKKVEKRVGRFNDNLYYDLVNTEYEQVKITVNGCEIVNDKHAYFVRGNNMKAQVTPDMTVEYTQLPSLLKKHFRLKNEKDIVLFSSYLVTCFIPDIPHPILVLHGEKGAAKSTTMRMIRSIVDPSIQDIVSMPSAKGDLAVMLANNYMPSFDNFDILSAEKSDMLCMAATGGGFSKRQLFTDDDEIILRFLRCVMLNGINIVATRADLLDRSLLQELDRISESERKTEKEVWQQFEEDKPKILGAILLTLSKAIAIYDTVKLDRVGRMADFTYWGYAVAESLEVGGDNFVEAYLNNQNKANEEAVLSHPVAAAICALMKNRYRYKSSVSGLLRELESVAETEMIDTKVKAFPKAPNMLSMRLKEVKSNLQSMGIDYSIRNIGTNKEITITNSVKPNGEDVEVIATVPRVRPTIQESNKEVDLLAE